MLILFLIIIVIIGVNAVILFLLQSGEMMFTKDSPKMSFSSVVIGMCLGVFVLFIIIMMLRRDVESGLFNDMAIFLPIFLAILIPICSLVNLGFKIFYDYLLLPHFRKMKDVSHIRVTLLWIKISIIIGFFLLVLGKHVLNEQRRALLGREYLESILGESLLPSVTHIRYMLIRRYDDNSHWVKFTYSDGKVIEKIQSELTASDSCQWWGPSPPPWWDVREHNWGLFANSEYLKSYVKEEDVSFCYDTQNHIAYYHTIWRDF